MTTQIKDAVITAINNRFPSFDVCFEEIPQTDDKLGDYIFAKIYPISLTTVSKYLSDVSIMVDIAACCDNYSNSKYLELAMQIDELFRPVFQFGDRYITVADADTRIVDQILHYSFTLDFRVTRDIIDDSELMLTLESKIE